MDETKEKKQLIYIGFFNLTNIICETLIKAFGSVIIYQKSHSIAYVFYYILIYSAVQMLSNVLLAPLFKNKPKLSLILRTIPFVLMYSVFFFSLDALTFTIIISVTNGLINSFYLAPMDNLNGRINSASVASNQSIVKIIEYCGQLLFTFISGILLDWISQTTIALIGIVIYVISTIIFYFGYKETPIQNQQQTKEAEQEPLIEFSKGKTKKSFNPFKNYYPWLTEALIGITAITTVLWNVYCFVEFQSFTSVAIMNTLIALANLIGSIIIKRFGKSKDKLAIISIISVIMVTIIFFIRPFALNIFMFYTFALLLSLLIPMYEIPLRSTYYRYYKNSKNQKNRLIQKDFFRKLFIIPLSLICFCFNSILFSLLFMSGVFGFLAFQVFPTKKIK